MIQQAAGALLPILAALSTSSPRQARVTSFVIFQVCVDKLKLFLLGTHRQGWVSGGSTHRKESVRFTLSHFLQPPNIEFTPTKSRVQNLKPTTTYLPLHTNSNSRWIKALHVGQTNKKTKQEMNEDTGRGRGFKAVILKAQATEATTDQGD